MIGLLQRVSSAKVVVAAQEVAGIDSGLLVLIGIQPWDDRQRAARMLQRLLTYRVFNDRDGKMNLDLLTLGGGLLLVPQFTLAADTGRGRRPSFATAAAPADAQPLFEYLCGLASEQIPGVQCGHFGADMQVMSVNDGPVTFWLEV